MFIGFWSGRWTVSHPNPDQGFLKYYQHITSHVFYYTTSSPRWETLAYPLLNKITFVVIMQMVVSLGSGAGALNILPVPMVFLSLKIVHTTWFTIWISINVCGHLSIVVLMVWKGTIGVTTRSRIIQQSIRVTLKPNGTEHTHTYSPRYHRNNYHQLQLCSI